MTSFSAKSPHVITADEALRLVQSGQRVYIGGGCGDLAEKLVIYAPHPRATQC
jgi:hypothetical protein